MKKEISLMFFALSDENRLTLLELLMKGETCGCTLINKLSITQPTMSYHLKTLAKAGLITSEKSGIWNHHHLNPEKLDILIHYLMTLKSMKKECTSHE
ncbi:MAG: metalloregulator ArsR/SmtB family transcription factor [Bacilli bacterium]|nr:metalloregulator ArsR/SmtB family transcription factor [Bacilli bacterium]